MTYHNPWLGLASYEDTQGTENSYQFCGRDEETLDVLRLIDNNLFITLYGSSGIGKTSLLRAGVIPILRRKDYFPIYVRLSQEPKEQSYAEAIVRKLQNSGLTQNSGVATKHPDGNDRLYLWNYFATTRFLKENREVYPVIILDQFEEVFREGNKAKVELLLKQIYLLLNDELEMPDEAGYSADTNYRFVASIREDFLFVLEDCIDENSMELFKNNRYRLRPMKPENAREVVLIPGKDCVEETEKDAIAERILSLATRPQSDTIDTLLLSLVCAGTYDKKAGEKITLGDLSVWKNNPMEVYYQEAIKGLSADQVRYIQQHLIREDGSRKRMDADEVKAALGASTYQQLTQGKNRLFAIGDNSQVELLHDQLGIAVYEERKAFEEQEHKRKRNLITSGIVVFALLSLIIVVWIWRQNTALKKIEWEYKGVQTSRVAEKIISLASADSYLARILALEILPKDVNHPERPYKPEAEKALRMACEHNTAIFEGSEGTEVYAEFSPNGKTITSRINGNTILTRNAESGAIVSMKTIDNAYLVKYSPDGNNIVSASRDSLKMWNAETGEQIWGIGAYYPDLVSFSLDGSFVVFANDTLIKVISALTGKEILSLLGHDDWIHRLSISPDGSTIVSVSFKTLHRVGYAPYEYDKYEEEIEITENTIIIWDAKTGEMKHSFPAHFNLINSIDFSPSGRLFVTTSYDRAIKVWDVESGKEIQNMKWEKNSISNHAVFTPNGEQIVSGHTSGLIKIWDVETGELIKQWKGHSSEVVSLAFSHDGQRVVSTSKDATMKIWDMELGDNPNVLARIDSSISVAKISPSDEDIMFMSLGEHFLSVFNTVTSSCYELREFLHVYNGRAFSPDGRLFAASSASDGDGTLMIWSTKTGEVIRSLEGHANWISTVVFSPDGKQLISSSWDGTTRFWDVETGQEIRQFPLKTYAMVYSPDMKVIAFVHEGSKNAMLCDAETMDTLMMLEGHLSSISTLAYSPDGKTIASFDANATTKLWNSETGDCLQSIKGYFVTFSPNNSYCILRNDQDLYKTIDVYKTENGQCVYSITRNTDSICDVAFSEDNSHIIAVLSDGTIRQWDFPPLQDLIDQTRERFKDRPLTPEERHRYYLE